MITEDYVSFETAKLLKEKGFDEPCDTHYHYCEPFKRWLMTGEAISYGFERFYYPCPTLALVMKWLREEKGIAVIPVLSSILDNEKFLWDIKIVVAKTNNSYSQGWVYEKQEEACEAAIKYVLENLI